MLCHSDVQTIKTDPIMGATIGAAIMTIIIEDITAFSFFPEKQSRAIDMATIAPEASLNPCTARIILKVKNESVIEQIIVLNTYKIIPIIKTLRDMERRSRGRVVLRRAAFQLH